MAEDHSKSIEDEFIRRALDGFGDLANGLHRALGPAAGVKQFTPAEQIDLATFTPYPDPFERQQIAIQLFQQGKSLEEVTDTLYPRLRPLIQLAGTGIRDQITYARDLRERIDKKVPPLQQEIVEREALLPGPFELDLLEHGQDEPIVDPLLDVEQPQEALSPVPMEPPSMMTPPAMPTPPMPPSPVPPPSAGPIPSVPPFPILGG